MTEQLCRGLRFLLYTNAHENIENQTQPNATFSNQEVANIGKCAGQLKFPWRHIFEAESIPKTLGWGNKPANNSIELDCPTGNVDDRQFPEHREPCPGRQMIQKAGA